MKRILFLLALVWLIDRMIERAQDASFQENCNRYMDGEGPYYNARPPCLLALTPQGDLAL